MLADPRASFHIRSGALASKNLHRKPDEKAALFKDAPPELTALWSEQLIKDELR